MKKSLKVLLVDDNETFLNALEDMIINLCQKTDIIVDKANSGSKALVKTKGYYDIVFIDVHMKDMNGIEATKIITSNNRFIKVIALSSYDDMYTIKSMLEAGARTYLIKDELTLERLKCLLCNNE
jgi:CheY-like chemotaxis protein